MVNPDILLAYATRAMTLGAEHGLNLTSEGDESGMLVPTLLVLAGVGVGVFLSYTFIINAIEAYEMIKNFPNPDVDKDKQQKIAPIVAKKTQVISPRIHTDPSRRIYPGKKTDTTVRLTRENNDILMPGPNKRKE